MRGFEGSLTFALALRRRLDFAGGVARTSGDGLRLMTGQALLKEVGAFLEVLRHAPRLFSFLLDHFYLQALFLATVDVSFIRCWGFSVLGTARSRRLGDRAHPEAVGVEVGLDREVVFRELLLVAEPWDALRAVDLVGGHHLLAHSFDQIFVDAEEVGLCCAALEVFAAHAHRQLARIVVLAELGLLGLGPLRQDLLHQLVVRKLQRRQHLDFGDFHRLGRLHQFRLLLRGVLSDLWLNLDVTVGKEVVIHAVLALFVGVVLIEGQRVRRVLLGGLHQFDWRIC